MQDLLNEDVEFKAVKCEKEMSDEVIERMYNMLKEKPFKKSNPGNFLTCTYNDGSVIVTKKDYTYLVDKLEDKLISTFKESNNNDDLTDSIFEQCVENNLLVDEYELFLMQVYKGIYSKGFDLHGFNYKVNIVDGRHILSKQLICSYAVKLFADRNKPYMDLYKIDKESFEKSGDMNLSLSSINSKIPYAKFNKSLSKHMIKEKDVMVIESEFEHFYEFSNSSSIEYVVKLTPNNVNKWWNVYNKMARMEPNLDVRSNWFGVYFTCWADTIIDCSGIDEYVNENITEEEIKMITQGKEDTIIAEKIKRNIKCNNADENHAENIKAKIIKMEEDINKLIDENKSDILREAYLTLYEKEADGDDDFIKKQLDSYCGGLDCGFVYLRPKSGEEYEIFEDAKTLKIRTLGLEVNELISNQSTTAKFAVNMFILKLVREKLNINLCCKVVLD